MDGYQYGWEQYGWVPVWLGTNMAGYQYDWVPIWLGTSMAGYQHGWVPVWLGTNMAGYQYGWDQYGWVPVWLDTNMAGYQHDWVPIWLGTNMAAYPTKTMSFWAKYKKTHFCITIPIRGCSSFIDCKAWRHESESLNTMYLDAIKSLICSKALMIAQTSAVNMESDSGNLMEITVFDDKQNCSSCQSISIP